MGRRRKSHQEKIIIMEDSQKNNDHLKEFISEFQTLSTFAEVEDWSKRAEDEIGRVSGFIRELDIEIARDAQALERVRYEHAQKPLIGRLFSGGNNEEKELSQRVENSRQYRLEKTRAVIQLQEFIDFTPKSSEEQKALVKELRQRKRELQEKKREITMVIRSPNTQPQKAQTDNIFDAATLERRKVRYAKDAELLPQEITKAALDRQFAQIDRDIQWAEKFNQ